MKKVLLTSLFAAVVCTASNASDGGLYQDTETYQKYNVRTVEYSNDNYVAARPVVRRAPCSRCAAQPVRVKTYSEVIDHYQVYQPVTVYQPVGEYATRRVVSNRRPCGCGR